jgi:hypothetical protein
MSAISIAAVAWLGLQLVFLYKHEDASFRSLWKQTGTERAGRRGTAKVAGDDTTVETGPQK